MANQGCLADVPFYFHPDNVDAGRGMLTEWIAEVKSIYVDRCAVVDVMLFTSKRTE